uniref:MADF domain-containing protein n=2 Tax=Photinus pyralis TaxID=7054 RepID=A0A1Y1MVI3_PHOPY
MVTSPLYKNKHARNAALQNIAECLKSMGRNVTIPEIKVKWNGLRTNYLSELRKYESTQKSGAGADDILKPSLWYFDIMRFIDKYINPRKSTDVLDITAATVDIDNGSDDIDHGNDVIIEYIDESDIETINSNISSPATFVLPTDDTQTVGSFIPNKKKISSNENIPSTPSVRPSRKVRKEDKLAEEQALTLGAIRTAIEQRKPTPTYNSPFSNYVAFRLNSITDDTIRATAEEEIMEVIFRNYKIFINKQHNV